MKLFPNTMCNESTLCVLQWEFEKWKFESKNQVMFFSLVTGKALRIKSDGTVDGLGEQTDPGSECVCNHGSHYHHHLLLLPSPHHQV